MEICTINSSIIRNIHFSKSFFIKFAKLTGSWHRFFEIFMLMIKPQVSFGKIQIIFKNSSNHCRKLFKLRFHFWFLKNFPKFNFRFREWTTVLTVWQWSTDSKTNEYVNTRQQRQATILLVLPIFCSLHYDSVN